MHPLHSLQQSTVEREAFFFELTSQLKALASRARLPILVTNHAVDTPVSATAAATAASAAAAAASIVQRTRLIIHSFCHG